VESIQLAFKGRPMRHSLHLSTSPTETQQHRTRNNGGGRRLPRNGEDFSQVTTTALSELLERHNVAGEVIADSLTRASER